MDLSPETFAQYAKLGLTPEEVAEIAIQRPSLRGMIMGYAAEYKVRKEWFVRPEIHDLMVPDDHDRTQKFDIGFTYRGVLVRVEVKSLQTASVRKDSAGELRATFQCDASDRRRVTFPSGGTLETTCILMNAFDLLAVGLFAFGNGWKFAFALNSDLPHTTRKLYSDEARANLLATSMPITWPLKPPYAAEPYRLLDEIVRVRASQTR